MIPTQRARRSGPRRHFAALAITTIASARAPVLATSEEPEILSDLVAQSELVFRGVVQDVQYEISAPRGARRLRIPHTFVTYRVDEVLHGAEPGLTVTLRFLGGLDMRSFKFMLASHAPLFDVGDEDVLFVRGNTRLMCPLVGRSNGRLRLIDGQVFGESGRAITVNAETMTLRRGQRHRLEPVMRTSVLGTTINRAFGPEAVDGPANAIAAEALIEQILDAAAGAPEAATFVNANLGEPFFGPDLRAEPPPSVSDEEARESAIEDDNAAGTRPVKIVNEGNE